MLAGASAEDHAHAQARHDPYSSSPLRRARYPIGGFASDQRPRRGDAAGIGASDWMKPLAISRRSSRGMPKTEMRSPGRSARHVASFSCERSTDWVRPSGPRSATVDPLTASTVPSTRHMSSPEPVDPAVRHGRGLDGASAGHEPQRGGVARADGDARDLVGTAALDAEHGDAGAGRDLARRAALGRSDVGVERPTVVTADDDEGLIGHGGRPLERALNDLRLTGRRQGGAGRQSKAGNNQKAGNDQDEDVLHDTPPSADARKG